MHSTAAFRRITKNKPKYILVLDGGGEDLSFHIYIFSVAWESLCVYGIFLLGEIGLLLNFSQNVYKIPLS